MMMPHLVHLPREMRPSTTQTVHNLLYLPAYAPLHLERRKDIDDKRNALLAEAEKLYDLEHRSEQLAADRHNLVSTVDARTRDLDDREATLRLNQAAFETERDGVRAALAKDRA